MSDEHGSPTDDENAAIDRHKRPFAFAMRWALMALAFIALAVVIVWIIAYVA